MWFPGTESWRAALCGAALLLAPGEPAAQDARFKLKAGATGKACLECHVEFQDKVRRPFVHTPVRSGNCTGCHDPHASDHGQLLEADPDRVCARCHSKLVPEQATSVHAPVAAGRCVDCHDPHAGDHEHLLRRAGNELCAGCHAAVSQAVAAGAFPHPPAQRDCLACHEAHASSNSRALLELGDPALCVRCHNPTRPLFVKAHVDYPVARSRCSSCHDPHASDHRGILWANVHRPIVTRMCAQCHQEASSAEPTRLKKEPRELCRGCHSELYQETAARNRIHWPVVDDTGCANCHDPHAAKTAGLLRAPQQTLCGGCHADAVARQRGSKTAHQPVAEGDCSTCHAPHAADTRFLLAAADDIELCGTCHDWQKHSTHPIGAQVVDQRNPNLTVDCLSCHRSHGSPFEHLAHFDTKSDLCTQCHSELAR